jgi:hypothetical protein
VAQSNVTTFPLAADSETVNVAVVVPALPSARETSPTDRLGAGSLSVIVPTPWASPICPGAPTRFVRFTTNVSVGSSVASPTIGTETTRDVADFESVTVPDEVEKSPGAVAEPGAVAQFTWREQQSFGGGATWIVNAAVTAEPVPSVTVTSVIVTEGVGAAAAGEGRERIITVAAAAQAPSRTSADDARRRGTRKLTCIDDQSVTGSVRCIPDLGAIDCLGAGMDVRSDSGYLPGDPAPLLLGEPTPHAIALPVLERPGEAFVPDRARAAEREGRSRLLLRDGEEHVGVDPVAGGSLLPDIRRRGIVGQDLDVDGRETIDAHRSASSPRGSPQSGTEGIARRDHGGEGVEGRVMANPQVADAK